MLKINYPQQEQRKYNEYSISPSGLTTCARQLYYKYNNIPQSDPIDPSSLAKMEMGTVLHDWFIGLMENVVESEDLHEVNRFGFDWRYKLDAVTEENGERVINEVKTVPEFSYKMAKDKLDTESHVRQIQIYMILENCPKGRLIYLNRSSGEWMAYDFFMEENYNFRILKHKHANGTPVVAYQNQFPINTIMDKHLMVKQSIEQAILPKREYQMFGKNINGEMKTQYTLNGQSYRSDWQCKYCNWRSKCWKINEFINSEELFLTDFLKK